MKTWSESVTTYRGYRITANDSGYSVRKDGVCVAGGGRPWAGWEANQDEAKRAVRRIISGQQRALE